LSDTKSSSTDVTETKPKERWQGEFFALVLHPRQEKLLFREGEPSGLPKHSLENRWVWSGQAARLSAQDFGLMGDGGQGEDADAPIALGYRRWTAEACDEDARLLKVAAVYDAEPAFHDHESALCVPLPDGEMPTSKIESDPPAPTGWRWAGADDAMLAAIPEFEATAAKAFLAERREGPVVAHRQPWALERGAWQREVVAWMDAELAKTGRRRTGPAEIVKSWSISFVLKAPTDEGKVYFKASGFQPLFVNEAGFARAFALHFPDLSPDIVALDETRGWLLLDDFGEPVGDRDNVDEEEKRQTRIAVSRLQAQLQRRAAALGSDALLAAGCLDRRLPKALAQIEPLIEDEITAEALEAEELERLRAIAPRIATTLRDCAGLGLPDTLVHGDLHLGNVAQRDDGEGWVIFDWTDACLAHPFTDLIGIRAERDEALRDALREAYLDEWSDLLPADEIEQAWMLGGVAFHFHHAVSYQSILNHVEAGMRVELSSMLPMHLRKLIEVVEGLDSD
jgi:aminoglycoside/choline kinase family phosphotransferase